MTNRRRSRPPPRSSHAHRGVGGTGGGGSSRRSSPVTVAPPGSSKYAADIVRRRARARAGIVADEDGDEVGRESCRGEEEGTGPRAEREGRRGSHRRARAGVSPRGLSRDDSRRSVQPRFHPLHPGRRPLHRRSARVRRDLQLRTAPAHHDVEPAASLGSQKAGADRRGGADGAQRMPTFLANGFGFCEVDQPPLDDSQPRAQLRALQRAHHLRRRRRARADRHAGPGRIRVARQVAAHGGTLAALGGGSLGSGSSVSEIVRPSRVRAMLAMRACRRAS